jgi:hypothetical protein
MKIKAKHIDDDLLAITNVWQMIAYILSKAKLELALTLLIVILGIIAIMNVSYSKKDGLEVKPTIKIEKEIKK